MADIAFSEEAFTAEDLRQGTPIEPSLFDRDAVFYSNLKPKESVNGDSTERNNKHTEAARKGWTEARREKFKKTMKKRWDKIRKERASNDSQSA